MQNTTAPAAHLARDYAALTGTGVTEAHARYCREHGHATHTVNGVAQPHCPRCGEVRITDADAEIVALTEVTEVDRVEAALHARPRTRRFDRGTGRYAVTIGGYIVGEVQRVGRSWRSYDSHGVALRSGTATYADQSTRAHAVELLGRTDEAVQAYREAAREGVFGTAAERVERRRREAVLAAAEREQVDADPERDDEGSVTADLVDAAPVTMDCQGGSARCTGVVAERGMVVAALAGDLSRMPYCPPCRVAAHADAVLDEPVQGPAHGLD